MIFENVNLHNIREIIKHPRTGELALCRIPNSVRVHMNKLLCDETAFTCAGVEIRFKVNSGAAKINLQMLNSFEGENTYDNVTVYLGSFILQSNFIISAKPSELIIEPSKYNVDRMKKIANQHQLDWDVDIVRLVMPYGAQIKINSIEGDISPLDSQDVPEVKWLAYGSSITSGASGSNTVSGYIFKAAEKLGVEVYNFGFPGSAQVENEMADFIAEEGVKNNWDFATIELGVNMIWDSVKNAHGDINDFIPRVDYFLDRVANANPDKKIIVFDIFGCGTDYTDDSEELKRLNDYRKVVADKVVAMNNKNVIYVKGLDILEDGAGLTADLVHPSNIGMDRMTNNVVEAIKKYIF